MPEPAEGPRPCLLVAAFRKASPIPDLALRRIRGRTLLERCVARARAAASAIGAPLLCASDSQEIALACERATPNGESPPEIVAHHSLGPELMPQILERLASRFSHAIILDPACPLLHGGDVPRAWQALLEADADGLFSVSQAPARPWSDAGSLAGHLARGLPDAGLVQSPAISITRLSALGMPDPAIMPWHLGGRAREIRGYEDFWICERLLSRRHVVFVVAGYPAIGLGHVYRALMLAHEINNHSVSFVCTRRSELAVESIAGRDYPVIRQGSEPLAETVLRQSPDMVVNDLLDTDEGYMRDLAPLPLVNFEDRGPGAALASLTVNALYEDESPRPGLLQGPAWFCLRDEFLNARRNPLRERARVVLITFGGTDEDNCTLRCLKITEPIARAYGMEIRLVAGPGYAHKHALEAYVKALENPLLSFTWATNVMSRMMEGCDLCISAAGRTVYELCHMRVPGLVLAQHEREATHRFARPAHGFYFAGVASRVSDLRIRNIFLALLRQDRRALYWNRQNSLDFTGNKARLVALMQNLLEEGHERQKTEDGSHCPGTSGIHAAAHEIPAQPQGAGDHRLGGHKA